MPIDPDQTFQENFDLKQTILLFNSYAKAVLKKWYIFILMLAIGWLLVSLHLRDQEITYTGTISFMTNNTKNTGASQILQLAGQLGMGGSSGESNNDRIVELMRSRTLIVSTLLRKVEIEGDTDLLFNHYIRLFELDKAWEEDEALKDYKMEAKPIEDFTFTDNRATGQLVGPISGQFLNTNTSNSGIIRVRCTSESEIFSKVFIETLADALSDFYVSKTIEQQQNTYDLISERTDSLEKALFNAEYALAGWIDDNRGALRAGTLTAQKLIRQEQLKRNAEILNVMYVEAVKRSEIARINLMSSTPVLQILDRPTFPLKRNMPNARYLYIMVFMAIFVMTTVLIILHKIVRDALAS